MPRIIMVVVKPSLKLASTTMIRALSKCKCNATELSKALWQAKDAGKNPIIEWSIKACTTPYYPRARWCNLCLAKKLFILRADPTTMLNKRLELNEKYHHKNKFKLKNLS